MGWTEWIFLILGCSLQQVTAQDLKDRRRACHVLIAIDQPLWEVHDRNMSALADLANAHIEGLNEIFANQVFVDKFDSYYFVLKRL